MIEILFVDWSLVSSYQTKTSVQAVNQSEDSKFEAEAREFSNFLKSLEQFIQIERGQNNFW